jgi:hypothetical protein
MRDANPCICLKVVHCVPSALCDVHKIASGELEITLTASDELWVNKEALSQGDSEWKTTNDNRNSSPSTNASSARALPSKSCTAR